MMRGEATQAQIAGSPGRAAGEGRDGRRDHRVRRGDARARAPRRLRRRRRSSTWSARAATARRRSTSRRPPRSSPLRRARRSRSTATEPRAPRAGRPTCSRSSGSCSSSRPSGSRPRSTRTASGSCSRGPTIPPCATRRPCARSSAHGRCSTCSVRWRIPPARATACSASTRPSSPGRTPRRSSALGARRAFVVHGDGVDELLPTGPNLVVEVQEGNITEWQLDPRDVGLEPGDPEELRGGDAAENAATIRRVFGGRERWRAAMPCC